MQIHRKGTFCRHDTIRNAIQLIDIGGNALIPHEEKAKRQKKPHLGIKPFLQAGLGELVLETSCLTAQCMCISLGICCLLVTGCQL